MPDLLGLGAPPSGPSAPWQPPGVEFPRVVQVGTVVEDFETGVANTSYTSTSGQSSSGGNGTGTWNYVAASTWLGASGTLCSQLNITASSSWFRTLKLPGGGVTGWFATATFSYSAFPTGATAILNVQDESGTRATIATSATGSLLVRDANTTKFTSSYKFQPGIPYTVVWAGSAAATQRALFYDIFGTLLDDSGAVLFTTGSPLISMRFGSTAAPGVPTVMYFDNVGVSTIGPFAAPTVTAIPPPPPWLDFDPPMVGGNPGDFASYQWPADEALSFTNAEVAQGTGTAFDATPSVAPNAEVAQGTGTAGDATVSILVNAEVAQGTGTAGDPAPSVAPNAELASGTGTAYDATVVTGIVANAEAASGTGTAFDATVVVSPSAGGAQGTGTASDAAAALLVPAGVAQATGMAFDATVVIGTPPPGVGTVTDRATSSASASDGAVGRGAASDQATGRGAGS